MGFLKRIAPFLIVLLAALLISTAALAVTYPPFTGPVVDSANMLSTGAERALTTLLRDYLNTTTNAVVVATVPSLDGVDIDTYSFGLFNAWGIGQAGKDNGVLLLVARDDRRFRIEVGYGLQKILTNERAGYILQNVTTPAFKKGDFDGGTIGTVKAIIHTISPNYPLDAFGFPANP